MISKVSFISTVFLLSALISLSQSSGSQIVDDSTRNVYGPNTTGWITEKDIFYNRNNYRKIDTSINNYHRWTYVQRFNNLYKDLGNVGTALYPIFPQLPTSIGVSTGYNVYDPYYLTEEPKYFDTKSPYTKMKLVWAGNGRSTTVIEFSRNINPRWNFGFNYRPILVDKQLQRAGKGDRQTISHYYDAYTYYRSKNDRYHLILNFRRMRHRVKEMGGITVVLNNTDSTYLSLFDENNRPLLSAATSEQLQNNVHLFQQYKIGKGLQVYYQTDLGKKINQFEEDLTVDDSLYYGNRVARDEKTPNIVNDNTRFSYWKNEIGVKRKFGKFFYGAYIKSRTYTFSYKYFNEDTLALPLEDIELYTGGRLSYQYDSMTYLSAWAEFLHCGYYGLELELQSKWVDIKAKHLLSKPSFLHTAYRGSFDFWSNRFNNVSSTQVEAFAKLNLGKFKLMPGFTYTRLKDYIYFRKDDFPDASQRAKPVQSAGQQQLLSSELRFQFQFWRKFYLRPQIIYSEFFVNDDDALRLPKVFVNNQLAYENFLFKNNLQVQIGLDMHWKSNYFDLSYDPAIRQYYVQNDIAPPTFPLVDVFFNAKMKRGRFFLKYHNLVQAFTKSGFLPTPIYPGQRNILDFCFELLLFD